jgi:hypothetical protein
LRVGLKVLDNVGSSQHSEFIEPANSADNRQSRNRAHPALGGRTYARIMAVAVNGLAAGGTDADRL